MTNFHAKTGGSATAPYDTWAKAEITLLTQVLAATDVLWVSDNHAESQATAWTMTLPTTPGCQVISVNDAADPPTALLTGASITNTGNVAIVFDGCGYVNGLQVIAGSGSAGATCRVGLGNAGTTHALVFDNSKLECRSSSGSAPAFTLGPAAASANKDVYIEVRNSSFRFGATGQSITLQQARVRLPNITLDAAGSIPTTLFKFTAGCDCDCVVYASDLTGRAWTNLVNVGAACSSSLDVLSCKLPASFTPTTGTFPNPGGPVVRIHRCNNGDVQSYFYEGQYEGSSEFASAIYRTAGSQDDDAVHYSCKMISSANAKLWGPLKSPRVGIPITAVGSSKTVTGYIAVDGTAPTLKNDGVWMEIIEYTTSGVPLGIVASSRMADVFATPANLTTSTEGWTGLGGTNAKFEIALSFTPQEKGNYAVQFCIAEPSRTLYADFDPPVT